jgi:hypothetical protein
VAYSSTAVSVSTWKASGGGLRCAPGSTSSMNASPAARSTLPPSWSFCQLSTSDSPIRTV